MALAGLAITRSFHWTCRVISATHRDLTAMAAEGQFRQDLIYRLEELEIAFAALRDRLEDISELVDHFLTRYQAPAVDGVRQRDINDGGEGADGHLSLAWQCSRD